MDHLGGKCLSGDADMDGVVEGTVGGDDYVIWQASADPAIARGLLQIPNLGTNRYAMTAVPPPARAGSRRPPSRATTTGTPG